MPEDSWLVIVVGASAVVGIVLFALVLRSVRGHSLGVPEATSGVSSEVPRQPAAARGRGRGRRLRLGGIGRPRHHRSVEGNVERALSRIDGVDPFVAERKIAAALAEVGLVSSPSVFDDPALPEPRRPRGEADGSTQPWKDEA
jgi:hypothetical protein